MLTAGEFCNRQVVVGRKDEPVFELARRMGEHHVGSIVLVEDRVDGLAPVGIITDRDIVVDLLAVNPARAQQAVAGELIGRRLIVALEDEGLDEAIVRMRGEGVRRLPVVDSQGILQGIIALDDLIDHMSQEIGRLASLLLRERSHERERRPAEGFVERSLGSH